MSSSDTDEAPDLNTGNTLADDINRLREFAEQSGPLPWNEHYDHPGLNFDPHGTLVCLTNSIETLASLANHQTVAVLRKKYKVNLLAEMKTLRRMRARLETALMEYAFDLQEAAANEDE